MILCTPKILIPILLTSVSLVQTAPIVSYKPLIHRGFLFAYTVNKGIFEQTLSNFYVTLTVKIGQKRSHFFTLICTLAFFVLYLCKICAYAILL